jgi:hypothetical protein
MSMVTVMLSTRSEARPSISEAVSSIMMENHLLYEALKLRIVNYHALAERVKKDVEEMTGRKVSVASVVVAIKRFSDGLEGNGTEVAKILKDAKLSLVGRAADLTIEGRGVPTIRILGDLLKISPKFVGSPNILQLPSSVKVLADLEDAQVIKGELSDRYSVTITGEAAKIVVRISQKAERVPGIAAFITELLYRNGISMLDMFYGYEDLLLVVEARLGPKAYQVLASKIVG